MCLPLNYKWMEQLIFQYKKFWAYSNFQDTVLAFIRPSTISTFNCHKAKVSKLITKLRLELNHLRFHKFKHNFQNTLNLCCNCGTLETAIHVLLHCPNFSSERLALLNKLQCISENIWRQLRHFKVLLFGEHSLNDAKNTYFLIATT